MVIGSIHGIIQSLFGSDWRPQEVHLHYPPPKDRKRYRDFFGCRVTFNAEDDAILLSVHDMGVTEHGEAVGCEAEAAPNRIQARCDGLVRQAVDQVKIDSDDAGVPKLLDYGRRLLEALHPIDRPLHHGIEALHAKARAVDAGEPHRLDHL